MAGAERNVISLLREQLKTVHEILEGTMADVTPEQAHWTPPGVALPIGATYAHVIVSEDGVVNGMFRGGAPLFAAAWAGKTGLSELPPPFDPKKPGFPDWSGWSRKVKVDLPALNAYAQAVYAASGQGPGPTGRPRRARAGAVHGGVRDQQRDPGERLHPLRGDIVPQGAAGEARLPVLTRSGGYGPTP